MTLTLEIVAPSAARPGDATRHVFGEEGGTIGRARSSSSVLTDSKISGQHARITFWNGVFYIEDTSRNGVTVNSPENRLVRNRPYALKGDRFFIEPHEIDVWIDAAADHPVAPGGVEQGGQFLLVLTPGPRSPSLPPPVVEQSQ